MAHFAEGAPRWVDGVLPDLEAGKRFYGELLGWTFGPSEAGYGSYAQAFRGGEYVAALAPKPDGRMPTVWNVYVAARDAVSTASRTRAAGGRVITDPLRIGAFGTTLTGVDPSGAVFAVWQPGRHDGFERQGVPGTYGWTELYTREPRLVDPFYQSVFGYGMMPATELGDADFTLWVPRGEPVEPDHAVGGRAVIGDRSPAELPSHFLIYFVVDDCDEAMRTAARLGGRTLHPAEDTPYGRFAILMDNQGASFAVIGGEAGGTEETANRPE